jgi:peptidoglycan/xylan/chitin deacetylase (PgdA/CDA1 family)
MKTRGAITLVFDDGYQCIFDHVVPYLNQKNIPAVFAIPLENKRLSTTEGKPTILWEKWLPLKKQGHEIAAHSITHTDLTTLSAKELEKELKEPSQALGATTVVYPGGAVNDTVVATAQRYYHAGRTVQRGLETVPPANPLQLRTLNFTQRNFSALRANMWALSAALTGRWLIETYHLVEENPTTLHSVPLLDFMAHIRFIKKLPVTIDTIQKFTS